MGYESNITGKQLDDACNVVELQLRSVNVQISDGAVNQWRKLLRFQLNASERTASGIVSVIARTGNDSMQFVTFQFSAWSGNLNATLLGKSEVNPFSKIRVNQIAADELWLEIQFGPGANASYFNVTPAQLYNCEIVQSKVFENSPTSQSSVELTF